MGNAAPTLADQIIDDFVEIGVDRWEERGGGVHERIDPKTTECGAAIMPCFRWRSNSGGASFGGVPARL